MKKRMSISMILALMMIASTFVVGADSINTSCNGGEPEQPGVGLVVEKTIWDGENWADPITAGIGDDVRFNISISYYPVDTDPDDGDGIGYKAKDLVVNDTLPPCLEYNNSLVIKHDGDLYTEDLGIEEEGSIYWYITRDYGLNLWDDPKNGPRTLYLEFNATVVSGGENENLVKVTGFETCGQEDLYDEDTALVDVPEEENPEIDVEKKYWNEDTEQWEDGPVTLYEGEEITFYINISNTGNVPLHNVIITDVVPDFFDQAGYISWNEGTLAPDEYYYEEFVAKVLDIDEVLTDKNYLNATADEDVFDEDAVEVTVKPHFIFEKKVWNGTGWADYIDHVKKNTKVKFRITATYYGDNPMKCLVIWDDLPFCLEYADNEKIWFNEEEITEESYLWPDINPDSEEETIYECGEPVMLPEGVIVWDWQDKNIFIQDEDSVVIEFETTVTEYCESCECPKFCWDQNCATGVMWNCHYCEGYYEEDCVDVRCCPPPTTFTKKVLDGKTWEDSIETIVGQTLTFKLELNYYGEINLTEVNFKDVLPCILEYDNNAEITVVGGNPVGNQEPEISSDGKTLWWNLTDVNLTDGGKIIITFDAKVTGTTGSPCDECEPCECINYAEVRAYNRCETQGIIDGFPMDDEVLITAESNCPPSIPQLKGDVTGKEGDTLSFNVFSTDSDGDKVSYTFDWDGETEQSNLKPEGVEQTFTHSWSSKGTYNVKVKATDEHGAESDWSYPLTVTITEGEEPEKTLEISVPKIIHLKNINANIKNNGPGDLTDIAWTFNITKEGLLKFDIESDGTIGELNNGKTAAIQSGNVTFKFGRAAMNITATAGELEETLTKNVFVAGRLMFVW